MNQFCNFRRLSSALCTVERKYFYLRRIEDDIFRFWADFFKDSVLEKDKQAIATALLGFNDLGRTVTPVFLLMDHFLYQFSAFSEKMKKIYRLEV